MSLLYTTPEKGLVPLGRYVTANPEDGHMWLHDLQCASLGKVVRRNAVLSGTDYRAQHRIKALLLICLFLSFAEAWVPFELLVLVELTGQKAAQGKHPHGCCAHPRASGSWLGTAATHPQLTAHKAEHACRLP